MGGTNDTNNTYTKKNLLWHEAECALLKNNSVRISLEEKDEKEASKVMICWLKIEIVHALTWIAA